MQQFHIDAKLVERVKRAKYLDAHINDKLIWSYGVTQVIKLCCKRIGLFKMCSIFAGWCRWIHSAVSLSASVCTPLC